MRRDLAHRWQTTEGTRLSAEVVRRLVRGESLADLDLGKVDGRIDLRGFAFPSPRPVGDVQVATDHGQWTFTKLEGKIEVREQQWRDLDLSHASCRELLLFGLCITNCVLDGADLRGTGGWAISVEDSSFRRADLRDFGLGHWKRGPSRWASVNLHGANLSREWVSAVTLTDCDFTMAKLLKTEFWGCELVRCRFEGELREVIFHRHSHMVPHRRVPMEGRFEDVDLRNTSLRWCEFRGLDLDGLLLPEDDNHIVLDDYQARLTRAAERLSGMDDSDFDVGIARRFVERDQAPGVRRGLVNRQDLAEVSPGFEEFFLGLLA